MKILLDECLPVDFRHHIPDHEVHTVRWAGYGSLKNGQLLRVAEAAGYDVFLTVDQGIPYQQSLSGMRIAVLILRASTNDLEDLLPCVPAILSALIGIQPGQNFVVG